jgi:hypothetical protein
VSSGWPIRWRRLHLFPGTAYCRDGTLSESTKAKGTKHLIGVLWGNGVVIMLGEDADVGAAMHHVLWDKWTKDEVGNGRFTGRLFDDHGQIYHGCTPIDAANHTLERLAALGAALRSYTIQDDCPQ